MVRVFQIQYIVTIAEKSISFKVEHQCPQCGAPVILGEDTLFFVCEFCRVRSCISQKGFSRYMFSPSEKTSSDAHIIYLPYWRFKGVRYTCTLKGVEHKFLDISCLAMGEPRKNIPISLGFRSQALPLKLVSAKTNGSFLRPSGYEQTLLNMNKKFTSDNKNVFQENIGETSSLIYSPFYIKNGHLLDGILNKPVGTIDENSFDLDRADTCRPEKETLFIPGLCPSCGWDLEGNLDSLVLVCRNCESLWSARGKQLARIKFGCARPVNDEDVLLPFWKISADISIIDLKSYSDLIKFGNLPQVPLPGSDKQSISFWAPAFKIRPKIFLRLITQLAILQPKDDFKKQLTKHTLHAVNFPSSEAIESIKVTLGALMKPATKYLPKLDEVKVTPKAIKLIYLPFESKSHDLYHPQLGVSINKNSLKLSENL
ncbi:MAG: hypothetical protein GY699_02255 [Desulfobacteraceae bacterium]|nr:hypothetical protein [Desulfobacteraceae bacterium]